MIENMNKCFNFMKVENGLFKHKQLEAREGQVFLRMKQRPVVFVTNVAE